MKRGQRVRNQLETESITTGNSGSKYCGGLDIGMHH